LGLRLLGLSSSVRLAAVFLVDFLLVNFLTG
jgi:hypothetical protein